MIDAVDRDIPDEGGGEEAARATAAGGHAGEAALAGEGEQTANRQALEDERDFLLRSLRDLDAEWEAGDLDEADYRSLRDDYTARTARVLRALEAPEPRVAAAGSAAGDGGGEPRPRVGRRWSPLRLAVVSAIVAAVVAGAVVAVVFSSGQRGPNQAISGLTPPGADPRLDQARSRIAKKDILGAIKLYDAVLAANPQQPEALTYRGWLLRLTSLQAANLAYLDDEGLKSIEAAEKAAPNYPDAHVFRGIILLEDRHDPADAVTEFRTFLSLDPTNPLVPTVESALQSALAQSGGASAPSSGGTPTPTTAPASGP